MRDYFQKNLQASVHLDQWIGYWREDLDGEQMEALHEIENRVILMESAINYLIESLKIVILQNPEQGKHAKWILDALYKTMVQKTEKR